MKGKMIEIGERLCRARTEAGYSQEAFAERIGCSAITISRWENGHTPMKVLDIVHIAEALKISTDFLLGIERVEADISDRIADLSPNNREIVMCTLEAMIHAMKSKQK